MADKKLMFSENLLKHWPNFWYCKIKPNKLPFFIDGINMNSFSSISGTFFYIRRERENVRREKNDVLRKSIKTSSQFFVITK